MKITEYMRIFVAGQGKSKIAAQKELEKINGVIIVDVIDQADYLFLPEQSLNAKCKDDLAYAKELGFNILTKTTEVQRLLGKTDIRLGLNRIKEDIDDEIEI